MGLYQRQLLLQSGMAAEEQCCLQAALLSQADPQQAAASNGAAPEFQSEIDSSFLGSIGGLQLDEAVRPASLCAITHYLLAETRRHGDSSHGHLSRTNPALQHE